jgi:hypothetical protein
MTRRYIDQVLTHFSDELAKVDGQAMTLSLRAHLLHEAKRLHETLKALVLQRELNYSEVFFINALEHFTACARFERAECLKLSCSRLKNEIPQTTAHINVSPFKLWATDAKTRLQDQAAVQERTV